jgi:hypothetical protein
MKELLEQGAHVNCDEWTQINLGALGDSRPGPLHCAVDHHQIDAIKFLLSVKGIDVNILDINLQSPPT